MSVESHLFCQLTRDLPIYFTFQMNCSLLCHSGILFCNLFCGPWQVENESWFSPLSCMLIVRPMLQVFACRTKGPDPVFREGKGTRLCNPTAADSAVIRRKYFFSSLAPLPLGSMAKNKLPCAACYWNTSWQFRGVWPWVWMCGWSPESKGCRIKMLERIHCLGYKSAFCFNEVRMKWFSVRDCP